MHSLIAPRMRHPRCARLDEAAAEIDCRTRACVDFVRFNERRSLERRGDRRSERAEHGQVALAFSLEFVPLQFVVKDPGDALKDLRAEAVLRMEMGKGQRQRTRSRPCCSTSGIRPKRRT